MTAKIHAPRELAPADELQHFLEVYAGRLTELDHRPLTLKDVVACLTNLWCYAFGNLDDAMLVGLQQVTRVDRQPTDFDRFAKVD